MHVKLPISTSCAGKALILASECVLPHNVPFVQQVTHGHVLAVPTSWRLLAGVLDAATKIDPRGCLAQAKRLRPC
jgi:hypothetical protein